MDSMRGILKKWTNYWNGWQPRWFVLENGLLSYYKSEEEVGQGCKGSVYLAACDINVHPSDSLRLDIVIPGEQHIYVRASSVQERQKWLVALGTAKAQSSSSGTDVEKLKIPDELKTKKSELRLYCDLLVQQVHSIKKAASESQGPDISKLDESTSHLNITCDTLINTLDECLELTNSMPSYANQNCAPIDVSSLRLASPNPRTFVHSNSMPT